MNNFEKIKQMSIDGMAMAFDGLNVDCTGYHCPASKICEQLCKTENITSCFKPFKQWLQEESEV